MQTARNLTIILMIGLPFLTGCTNNAGQADPQAKPSRPVKVATLSLAVPANDMTVTAATASWKTEEIGFEISGRIEWVVEPNSDVEGRVIDNDSNVIIPGEPIARINNEKYRLEVEKAKAELKRAKQNVAAAETELEKGVPAQFRAAEADLELAEIERDRRVRLVQKNAGAQADADKAEATYQNAASKIEQLKSTKKAKEAELNALNLQVDIATQSLNEAKRNLKNCDLYSSFPGQIADVAVVQGSFVSAGNPVATVQMMDPIKVEFEVSAQESRRLRQQQNVGVSFPLANGKTAHQDGRLYLIDPIADPQTRTFTVTVLVRNRKTEIVNSESNLPVTDQAWPMQFEFLPGAMEGMQFVASEAIREDDDGNFVWKINNLQAGDNLPEDRILSVSKLRIEKESLRLPFLGNWIFQQVRVVDDTIDLEKVLVAGKLTLPDEDADLWVGDAIRVQPKRQWILRPGDVVQVDLSESKVQAGFFVPMDSIVYKNGKTYLSVVSGGTEGRPTIDRMEIKVLPTAEGQPTSSIREIEAVGGQSLEGLRYITQGGHFLQPGQDIRVVGESEPGQ